MNLIIDMNNIFIIGYSVDPTLNNNGDHVGAICCPLKMLQKLIRDNPNINKIYSIWDGKGGSRKRKEMNSGYKEGRSVPKPLRLNRVFQYDSDEQENESRRQQQEALVCILNTLPVYQIVLDGLEADDIIASIALDSSKRGEKSLILSNDKDFLQLLDDNICIYRPATKAIVRKEDMMNEYNIHPINFVIARAIQGDNSDNLKGVPGVGLKGLATRFPELKEDKWISIPEFILLVEEKQKEKTYKMFSSIIDNVDIIENNYNMMQLNSPLIDYNNKELLEIELNKKLEFDMDEFYKLLTANGIFGNSFRELITYFIKSEVKKRS